MTKRGHCATTDEDHNHAGEIFAVMYGARNARYHGERTWYADSNGHSVVVTFYCGGLVLLERIRVTS